MFQPSRFLYVCVATCLAAILLQPAHVAAQEASAADESASTPPAAAKPAAADDLPSLANLSLEELLNVKITTASKQEEDANAAPSSVMVFSRQEILRLGVRTLEQLLNFVPGFQGSLSEGDGANTIGLRGRHTDATRYLLLLVDGQRVNDPLLAGALPLMRNIPVEDIDQVEILRGPGSALYGANAFLGVINIKTNKTLNNAVVGAGSMHRRYAAANLAKTIGDLHVASFAKVYNDDGFVYHDVPDSMNRTGDAVDPARTLDASLNLEYKGLSLLARHGDHEFEGISCCVAYSRYTARMNGTKSSVGLSYKRDLGSDFSIDAGVNTLRSVYRHFGVVAGAGIASPYYPAPPEETVVGGALWTGYSTAGNVDLQWSGLRTDWSTATLMASLNGEYMTIRTKSISSQDAAGGYQGDLYFLPGIHNVRRNVSGYLQAKATLWSQLDLTVGGRYDWFSDTAKSFSPRAAAVWKTPIDSHVKLMYGRAFRPPTILELLNLTGTTNNPDGVKPEVVTTFEVAYAQTILDYGQGTITYFHNRIHDVIKEPAMINEYYHNGGVFRLQGIEAEVRSRDIFGFSVLGSYTHFIANAKDTSVMNMPKDFGAAAVNYANGPVSVNLNGTFHGKFNRTQFLFNGLYPQPNYVFLNCHLQVEVLSGLRAYGLVENITNRLFKRDDSGRDFSRFLFRGRTFTLGLRADL